MNAHSAVDASPVLGLRFPSAFEFNERLLLLLAEALHSRWFQNFLYDSDAERRGILRDEFTTQPALQPLPMGVGRQCSGASLASEEEHEGDTSPYSVWEVVEADPDNYRNVLYDCSAELRRSARGTLQVRRVVGRRDSPT